MLPVVGLIVMLIWCSGLGAMWAFVAQIGVANGLDPVLAQQALAISSGVAIVGAFAAAALAGKGVNRFVPVIVALLIFFGFSTPLPLPGEEGVEVSLVLPRI